MVNDTLLYDTNIKEAFYHTFDFLTRCAQNGIVLNKDKFQFCKDTVQCGGVQITSSGVSPSESMLNAILNFPVPKTITDARSWFGLVNQLTWAYSLSSLCYCFGTLSKRAQDSAGTRPPRKHFKNQSRSLLN